jgi:hypothetical protein
VILKHVLDSVAMRQRNLLQNIDSMSARAWEAEMFLLPQPSVICALSFRSRGQLFGD